MKKFPSLALIALLAPAVTLSMGSALAQEEQSKQERPDSTEEQIGPTEREKGPHVVVVPETERTAAEAEAEKRAQQQRAEQDLEQAQDDSQAPGMDARMAQGSTPDPRAYLTSRPANSFRVDQLIGSNLESRTDAGTIGSISDLVIDEDGQILAVIVEVGGFLGIGQKDVAIPWDSVERTMNDKGDGYELHVSASKEALTDAPEYKTDARK
ncbi:MAG TPA: PRC-barrel domain-containing protein [Thioalkalivibrio sp.]|nr:PRC-barrel domain-containing protein [Thioalkalivibrio sp.]